MTKVDYLDMRGFDPDDWTVMKKEEASFFLDKKGAVNMMYDIKERKAIEVFGDNAYIVNIKWTEKYKSESPGVTEKPLTVPPVPQAPSVQTVSKIPEVPKVPEVPKSDLPKKSGLLIARTSKLLKEGWIDSGISMDLIGESNEVLKTLFYKDIEDMSNDQWDEYFIVKQASDDLNVNLEMIDEAQINREDKRDLPWENFLCDKYNNTGEACNEQCDFCKNAEAKNETRSETWKTAKQKIEKIVEASGVPKENIIIASVPKTEAFKPQNIDSGKIKLRTSLLLGAGMELSDDNSNVWCGGLKIDIKDLGDLSFDDFSNVLEHAKDLVFKAKQSESKQKKESSNVPLNDDGSVNTSEMEEADAREAIIEHQKTVSGPDGKGKAVGTLTAKKSANIEDKSNVETIEKEEPIKEEVVEENKTSTKTKKFKKEKIKEVSGSASLPIVVASEEMTEQLILVDNIVKTCVTFKNTAFAIVSIKEILELDDVPESKLEKINLLIQNLK
jgi:hypothetical protein